ncbi:unnamed protein product [Pedinophyceae sp. YPF-701]|nr:unnamed protein product [Pedinophyceae sp. YPF-701]
MVRRRGFRRDLAMKAVLVGLAALFFFLWRASSNSCSTEVAAQAQRLEELKQQQQQQQATSAAAAETPKPKPAEAQGLAPRIPEEKKTWLKSVTFEGEVERQILSIFDHVLSSPPKSKDARVIDVGMNLGSFTLHAASLGYRVESFDPQPGCVRLMHDTSLVALPELKPYVNVYNVGLGPPHVILADDDSCAGDFGMAGEAKPDGGPRAGGASHEVAIVPVRHLFQPTWDPMVLVKVDTEGAESVILPQLLPLAEAGRIENIVVEVMPRSWAGRGGDTSEATGALARLQKAARRTVLLHDDTPFDMPGLRRVELGDEFGVQGAAYEGLDFEALVENRVRVNAGSNVWFMF